jgi:hypothetical protein
VSAHNDFGVRGPSPLLRLTFAVYAAFAFAVPIVRAGLIPVASTLVQLADLLFVLCAGLFGVALLRGEVKLPPKAWTIAAALFFVGSAVSVAGTENPKHSLVKLFATGYLLSIAVVTYGLACRSKQDLRFVLASWAAPCALTGVLGVLGALGYYVGIRDRSVNIFLWNYGSIPSGSYPRIVVLFMNANMLCSYLLVGLGALGMLAPFVSRTTRYWSLAAAAAMCVTSVFTLSTGLGGIALGVAIAWALFHRFRGTTSIVREGVVLLGGFGAAAGFAIITIFLLVAKGQGDVRLGPVDLSLETSGRVSVWDSSAHTFARHPIKGIGIGALVAETSHPRALNTVDKLGTAEMNTKPTKMEAHNVWLNVAAQVGLVGLVPFLALIGLVTRASVPRKAEGEPWTDVKIAAASCLVAALYYHGFFGSFEDSRHYWFLFGVILAIDVLAKRPVAASTKEEEAAPTSPAALPEGA